MVACLTCSEVMSLKAVEKVVRREEAEASRAPAASRAIISPVHTNLALYSTSPHNTRHFQLRKQKLKLKPNQP